MATLRLTVTLKPVDDPKYPSATWIEATPHMLAKLGGKGRIPIRGTINGFAFRTTIVRYAGWVGFVVNRAMREGAGGVAAGDRVKLVIDNDDAPRTIDVPPDLAKALKRAKLERAFAAMSFTHRKEHIRAILDAKRPETRTRRIDWAVERVKGQSRPPLSAGARSTSL